MAPRPRCLAGLFRLERVDGVWVAWIDDVGGNDPWHVSCGLVAQGRRAVLREVRVRLKPGEALPPGGLTADTVHGLRFGDVVETFTELLAAFWAAPGTRLRPGLRGLDRAFPFLVASEPPPWRYARGGTPVDRKRGRPRLSNEILLNASLAYVAALDNGSPRPVQ